MSKQLIKNAQDSIAEDKEDEIVEGIEIKITSIESKEEQIKILRKEIKDLKKDLVEVEAEDYSSLKKFGNTNTLAISTGGMIYNGL